jgi:hypothetical protein
MTLLFKLAFSSLAVCGMATTNAVQHKKNTGYSAADKDFICILPEPAKTKAPKPKIQAAILLDVSNSMDGLIDQAKAQLWNMVSIMGKATCEGTAPDIEIALYEYGRSSNDVAKGYVKQIRPFTSDLDQLSQDLFSLSTNGGDEYCGQVIHTSLNELNWDASPTSYKVIFIAGNEDFLQGKLQYTQSCGEAGKKGVIVNTIYCGDRMQGIREHWNLGGECGNGSYTNINSNAKIEDIPTPYDSTLISLSGKLNGTYVTYGALGADNQLKQATMDTENAKLSKGVAAKRAAAKANGAIYRNSTWDLVDAANDDKDFIAKVDMKTLPDSLKNKSREQLQVIVNQKKAERSAIQGQIQELNKQRDAFIAAERAKNAAATKEATLETEVEKTIKTQAQRFNMKIE